MWPPASISKKSQQFLAFVLNTFRGHILRSIHHQSLLSVLACIQNTFCKKVYGYILCCFGIPFCAFCVCYYDGDHHDHQCATVTLTILLCMGFLVVFFWPSWFAIWDMWMFHSRTFSCLIFRIGEADRQTQTLPKWINLQPFSYQSSIWFMRVSCLENSRSGQCFWLLAYKCPKVHSFTSSKRNKKNPPPLNNFICFPPPMKEKICHLILRIGKKVRNKRKRKWCPFQNHSFEFMIFNGGNLVWKYLKSWAKCQDKQLYVFLSRKG